MFDNTSGLEDLRTAVGALLAKHENPHTSETIRVLIRRISKSLLPEITDENVEQLARHFETIHDVAMDIGSILKDQTFEPWLESSRSTIDNYYWERYKKLLAEQEFSGQVIAALDNVTDRTLGLLENPTKNAPWDRRGLVMGHVQSGKTANYIGLICKAADAGYSVVIVIAGIHNNLRNQTQMRIDEGFIGYDSARILSSNNARARKIGVGRFNAERRPNTFTNSFRDFNHSTATSVGIPLANMKQPAVFVIKKNVNSLSNLIAWLTESNYRSGSSTISKPMLLIDDEADNASINIKKGEDEVSRINGLIRELLELFNRRCYIGYTATPFANIFIDPDSDDAMFGQDLFPRDFIVSLDPPTNYFGPTRLFLNESQRFIRNVNDNSDTLPLRHSMNHDLATLPSSLRIAVQTFIIARAIRIARGQRNEHNSMLVNASRFVAVQNQIRNEIHQFLEQLRSSIRIYGSTNPDTALKDPDMAALHDVFNTEYRQDCGMEWRDLQQYLWESVSAIVVKEVNNRSPESLDYSEHSRKGLNVIAVGGYSLSRGLTLRGLVISYFLRNSMMYDTLMQMGRWFGYRPEYEDLCRIWMPERAEGWYGHIAESVEELRDELRSMESVGATPMQFGLKVRSHPEALMVTARNKMGSSVPVKISIGLSNCFIETAILRRDAQSLLRNLRAAIALASNLRSIGRAPEDGEKVGKGDSSRLVRSVPVRLIVDFLGAFRNHEGSMHTDPGPLRRYIEKQVMGELREWDVLFFGVGGLPSESYRLVDSSLGFTLTCQRRTEGDNSDDRTLMITNKQRVASRGVERYGLTEDCIRDAERRYREEHRKDLRDGKKVNYPDRIFRRVRTKPLLVIHLLEVRKGEKRSVDQPVVAWSMSFPKATHSEERVEWWVNTTWVREQYLEEDEGEASGDDE